MRTELSPPKASLADHLFVVGAWAVACLVIFVSLGSAPLTDLDEGAFSEATREMLSRGDLISPWLLDAPRFDKPALFHWLQMVAFSIAGQTSFGARLPSAVMGLVWVGGIAGWAYLIASRIAPQSKTQAYGWAVLIAGTCLGIPAMSRAATADASLNAFLVISCLLIWRALWPLKPAESGRIWIRLAAICIGLGLLAKGPIAILVPGAASLVGSALSGLEHLKRWLRLAFDPLAWFAAIVVAGPWYALQFQAQGPAFIEGFLGLHNLGRFTSTMHGFSAGPLYYPTWMLIASLPWTVPVALALLSPLTRGEVGRIIRRPELRICWAVLGFVLVFFSFSATKLPHYGFYGLSGLVVITSLVLSSSSKAIVNRTTLALPVLILLALLVFLGQHEGLASLIERTNDPYYRVVLTEVLTHFETQTLFLAAVGFSGLAAFVIGFREFRAGILIIVLVLGMFLHGLVIPTVMKALRGPLVQIAQLIQKQKNTQAALPKRVITWRLTAPSLSFEARQVIPASVPTRGDWVVLQTHLLRELPLNPEDSTHVLFEQTGICLIEIREKQ